MLKHLRLNGISNLYYRLAIFSFCILPAALSAQNIVLHLKSGDRLSGLLVSETNNTLVLSNNWNGALAVPLSEISQREIILAGGTNFVSTNAIAGKSVLNKTNSTEQAKTARHWRGEAQLGLDLIYSAKDQQIFHGKLKLDYQRPYDSDPKLFFKNSFEYTAEYGKTTGKIPGTNKTQTVKSSDRMNATDKTTFDLIQRWYAYNLASVGYDAVQKIDLQYEVGPGIGYHLVTRTNLAVNTESGLDYQVQLRSGNNADSRDFFYRLAEDVTWKLNPRTGLTEKLELFPRVDLSEFRLRFETTLSYDVWKNVSLNFTVIDRYDTRPATGVNANELQVRSALGVKF
jgi:hypothetical protein